MQEHVSILYTLPTIILDTLLNRVPWNLKPERILYIIITVTEDGQENSQVSGDFLPESSSFRLIFA